MRQPYAYDANDSTRRLVEDGMSTGLTNTHTARGFSVLYHAFARKQCILGSALLHKGYLTYTLLSCVTSIRDFFCLGTIAHGSTALLGCRLAASRVREAARWQLEWGRLLTKKHSKGALIGAKSNHYGTWYWIYWRSGYSLCNSLSQSWDTGLSVALFISVVITSSTKSMVSFTTPWTW